MTAENKRALIIVDLQNDFCEGGSLAVPRGDEVVPMANELQKHFDLVIATQDWHPADHMSFAVNHPGREVGEFLEVDGEQQVLWPVHCVQDTDGAQFHPDFQLQHVSKIVHKGADRNIDSYSAFFDNRHQRSTGLYDYLKEHGVTDIYIMGLATDYCVKFSCLDAVSLGLKSHLILDACRGIDLRLGDVDLAVKEMRGRGVHIINVNEI